ncbi:MAG: FliH/SctL family protein [Deltaproteobacteria bacterium]|nr:FliH/SctL family protein [Deltaproteobacteria bacterium]
MKDSSSFTPLKLESLKGDEKKSTPLRFNPLFAEKTKEPEVTSEVKETKDYEERVRKIFEEAYAQGEKAGYEMGMKKVEPLIKRLNSYIANIEAFKQEMVKKAEKLALELSFIIAESLILKECSVDKNAVINMVKKALDLCDKRSEVIIKVRSEDASYISTAMPSIKIVPDDTIGLGFMIESNFGVIDGTIRTQIEEIKKEISNFIE